MRAMPAAISLLLAWSLFAFGAVYDWALAPALVVSLGGVLATRILNRQRSPWRLLDVSLYATVAAALIQLVPLPLSVVTALSPSYASHVARVSLVPAQTGGWVPLSLGPHAWLFGAGLCLATIATFLWTRDALDSRGVRLLARIVAWMGLVVSVVALIQPSLFPNQLIYGFWKPWAAGADPVGPIISRNHFAAWVVLAWPLTIGYLVSHGRTHWVGRRTPATLLALSDTRALWLVLSAAMMIGGLLITRSRGGAAAFAIAVTMLLLLSWRRLGVAGRIGMLAMLVVVGAAVSLWATPDALLQRFDGAYSGADGGRPDIWRQSWHLFQTFPVAGVGLGAFDVVMPAYQHQFTTLLNHAHNQYLHVLVEGGLLVTIPAAVATLCLVMTAWRRLRSERGPMGHLRIGACAGLVGLAAMSVFEAPLLTPAVALLAAVNAAILTRGADVDAPPPDEADA